MVNQETLVQWHKLPAKGREYVKLYPDRETLFIKYLEKFKRVGPNGVLAIVRSNLAAQAINSAFRKELYGSEDLPVRVDDILLINRNNYKVPLTNGDFVTVIQIGEIESRVNLHFQKVRVKTLSTNEEYELLLSLESLYGIRVNLPRSRRRA